MEICPYIGIDDKGKLNIGGIEAIKLARRFGTPLYVYSEDAISEKAHEYTSTLKDLYPNSEVVYASKAYLTMRMAQVAKSCGLSLDVVSGGELFVALKSGFPPERIIFHGNNKSFEELDMAVSSKVGRIVIDNLEEIKRLEGICAEKKVTQDILIRLSPGIDAHTHKFLTTGEIDSKFGIPMYRLEPWKAFNLIQEASHLRLLGVHCHIGSQIFETEPYVMALKTMLNFVFEIRKRTGISISQLDVGGGLGVSYTGADKEIEVKDYLGTLVSTFRAESLKLRLQGLRILVEPGRSIVAKSGVTLYRIGTLKELPSGTIVAAVDGGMADNPRPTLYGAKYRAVLAVNQKGRGLRPYRIVGKNCEEGDTLIEEAWLPPLRTGDVLAVLVTGAYHYSMSSNYNGLLRPAVVHVAEGEAILACERGTFDTLIQGQRLMSTVKSFRERKRNQLAQRT